MAANALEPSKRIAEYDVARLIAVICVVLIHVMSPYVAPELQRLGTRGPIAFVSWELRFAVAMFVMLTGALVWSRQPAGIAGWPRFYYRRIRLVMEPYLFWSALYLAIGAYLGIRQSGSAWDIARDIALGTSWYHLYFVPVIIGVYLLTPLANALHKRSMLFAVSAFTVTGVVVPVLLAPNMRLIPRLVSLVTLYLPYAAFGAWYADLRRSNSAAVVRLWPVLLAVGLGIRGWLVLDGGWPSSPYVRAAVVIALNVLPSLGVLGLAEVLLRNRPGIGRLAGVWASFGFGVYLAHPLLLLAIDRASGGILTDGGLLPLSVAVLAVWPLTVIVSFAAVRRAARYRWLRPIHGVALEPRVSVR